jgi:hypothetical protein
LSFFAGKEVEITKYEGGKTPTCPRNMEPCHNISNALLQLIARIRSQSAMKSIKKDVA